MDNMEPPILDPDDPSIPPNIKEQIKNAAEIMAAIVYQQGKNEALWQKRKEKYKHFIEKINTAWKGSLILSDKDRNELYESILEDTYPFLEKIATKLITILTISDQITLILKDLFYMNMIIDIYRGKENMFGSSATVTASIGMMESIIGIIRAMPFADRIGQIQQEKALNDFREFQAANADTKQNTDSGDAKRSDRTPNDN